MDGALSLLKSIFGYSSFREGQGDLVDAVLRGRDVLGVMPTGGGKSLCYQLPALMLPGPTLVISPLISLMRDQVMALGSLGLPAAYVNSSQSLDESHAVLAGFRQGRFRLLYAAPERLETRSFLEAASRAGISFVAVGEAHCISQWGQDFRPSYLRIPAFLDRLPSRPVTGAFTATATAQVRADIARLLGLRSPLVRVTGFDRPNLRFDVTHVRSKYPALTALLNRFSGRSGIVYCTTRKTVETVHASLCRDGCRAARYHAGLTLQERRQAQEDFIYDRVPVMVATNAFGMGIDKSNVGFVIHYNMPKSLEAYYQEAGRAGRDGAPADCVLLYNRSDVEIARYLIAGSGEEGTDPDRRRVLEQNYRRLEEMRAYCETKRCYRGQILDYFGQEHGEKCGNCGNCLSPAPVRAAEDTAEDGESRLLERLKLLRLNIAREEGVPLYVVFTNATLLELARLRPTTAQELPDIPGVGTVKARRYGERILREISGFSQELNGKNHKIALANRPEG